MDNMKVSFVCAVRDLAVKDEVLRNIKNSGADEIVFAAGKNPSLQRNAGVSAAGGGIIYFIDDDSMVPEGLIERAAAQFEADPELSVLGGPELNPETGSFLQKVFGAVFASPFASGASSARYAVKGKRRSSGEKELILCNMLVRRQDFFESGEFDEKLYPNEENDLLNRMKEAGKHIVYDPSIFIYRPKRKSFGDFIRQCFNYGRGRAEQSVTAFDTGALVNFIPAFFVMYILAEIFLGASEMLPLKIYAALDICFSASAAVKLKSVQAGFLAFAAFLVLHLAYGVGTIYGLYTGFGLKNKHIDSAVNVEVLNLK
jgi:cellulose synthase/poly-beta-1,6-N-acetylglucosamine synthase-like glycosyltransferase